MVRAVHAPDGHLDDEEGSLVGKGSGKRGPVGEEDAVE